MIAESRLLLLFCKVETLKSGIAVRSVTAQKHYGLHAALVAPLEIGMYVEESRDNKHVYSWIGH